MLETVCHAFSSPAGRVELALPFALTDFLHAAGQARQRLVRLLPAAFSRDEWATLMTALDPVVLRRQIEATFGAPALQGSAPRWLVRPRGQVAVWLPANVSLLGPLTLLAVLASGNAVRLKASTRAHDLTTVFVDTLREKVPEMAPFLARVTIDAFDRDDVRNGDMAAQAQARLVFGADQSAQQIHALPHPLGSVGFSFVDRRSEAWIDLAAVTDDALRSLVRVFAIYGQAGCTSPSRVVLLDASPAQALALRDRLSALWPSTLRPPVPMHQASDNLRLLQLARATGWDAQLTAGHAAMLAVGSLALPRIASGMAMWIVPATTEQACASVPENLQTIGHLLPDPVGPHSRALAMRSSARRWVPLREMHHFDWVWDGDEYWRQLFSWTAFRA